MNILLLPLLTALIIGIAVGFFASWQNNPQTEMEDITDISITEKPATAFSVETDKQRIIRLEQELITLKQRIQQLEENVVSVSDENTSQTEQEKNETDSGTSKPEPLNKEQLISAGVSESLADDILRRKSEQEYKQLELRDRAIRDGYFRSGQYYKELRELNSNALSLRNEIGDDAYDRYLYQTGQNNRVQVSSVMLGSPAEQTGIQQNDIILSYDNQKVFDWHEVRRVTTKGELGEYVMVDVLRDGQIINLMLPRGPLGVKLDSTRMEPLANY